MAKVRLLKPFGEHPEGATLEVTDSEAAEMVMNLTARAVVASFDRTDRRYVPNDVSSSGPGQEEDSREVESIDSTSAGKGEGDPPGPDATLEVTDSEAAEQSDENAEDPLAPDDSEAPADLNVADEPPTVLDAPEGKAKKAK